MPGRPDDDTLRARLWARSNDRREAFCPHCGSQLWFNEVEEVGPPSRCELMPGLSGAAQRWPLRSKI
jgi:hypothetical protein